MCLKIVLEMCVFMAVLIKIISTKQRTKQGSESYVRKGGGEMEQTKIAAVWLAQTYVC